MSTFTPDDLDRLAERGIRPEEARRQLELIRRPPHYSAIERPCTVGDGILRPTGEQAERWIDLHAGAAGEGRLLKFVPASGAATRMFGDLLVWQRGSGRDTPWPRIVERAEGGDRAAVAAVRLLGEVDRFAFHADLAAELRSRGHDLASLVGEGRLRPVLDALLGPGGLDYAELPKGLLAFHETPDGPRTPFEEHLVEAAGHTRAADGLCRLHFTVSPEHRRRFEALLALIGPRQATRLDARFDVGFSTQKPATDTLAGGLDGGPFRDADGRLVFRPGGHGALIGNLAELDAELVYIKNIDNVQPDRIKPVTIRWKAILGGLLVDLQRRAFGTLERLRAARVDATTLADAERFMAETLQSRSPASLSGESARREWLIGRLDRPLRVCGVVRNTGEPGGGPYWVRGADGALTPQIVEKSQVDPDDAEQQRRFGEATHFNPVDLVCALRDPSGRPYDLERFVDEEAVIVTRKSADGRPLLALERPGLWNGAMAGWNTALVEVPLETFSPVKTVLDLLREEHR